MSTLNVINVQKNIISVLALQALLVFLQLKGISLVICVFKYYKNNCVLNLDLPLRVWFFFWVTFHSFHHETLIIWLLVSCDSSYVTLRITFTIKTKWLFTILTLTDCLLFIKRKQKLLSKLVREFKICAFC